MMTPEQCRMARAALRLGLRELAELGKTSAPTLCRFEKGIPVADTIMTPIQKALEAEGVVFLPGTEDHHAGIALWDHSKIRKPAGKVA